MYSDDLPPGLTERELGHVLGDPDACERCGTQHTADEGCPAFLDEPDPDMERERRRT